MGWTVLAQYAGTVLATAVTIIVQLLITSPAGGGGRSRIRRSRWHTRCERELAGTTDLKTQSNTCTCTLWYIEHENDDNNKQTESARP